VTNAVGRARPTRKGLRWFDRGHPWVFRDDLEQLDASDRLLVEIEDHKGRVIGIASHSPVSKIALRVLDRDAGSVRANLEGWFEERLRSALARRTSLAGVTDSFRVVSSEADGLPGLIVDKYADVVVLQALTAFVDLHLDHIVPVLVRMLEPRMVLARNDSPVRKLEGLSQRIDLCHGERVESVDIHEHDLVFRVDPFRGQKTGFFLDQRPARRRVAELARGRVLDLCCYTGGFALNAARGGAAEVVAVDSSEAALAEVVAGAERNGCEVRIVRGNVFDVLKRMVGDGERFDGVVLDPPAFARRRRDVDAACRGYRDLNSRALRLLRAGGWLVTCSCSANLRPERFRAVLAEAASRAGRQVLDRGRLRPAIDHPVLLTLPESDYLKVHWLESFGSQPDMDVT